MPNLPEMLGASHDLKTAFENLIKTAHIKESDSAKTSAYLCMTVAELFGSTLLLLENGYQSHAPVMVRSMFEGVADLLILVDDPNHLERIQLVQAKALPDAPTL